MATFSSFSASATLDFAATESFTNGPIICFNGTVTATSSLSASDGGNYVVWGASNYGLTGYNYLTLITSSISGSNLNVFIDVSKQLAGVDFGAYCESIIDTYVEGQNLYDLFSSHYIILSQSFLYPTIVVSPATLSFGDVYSNAQAVANFSVEGYNLLTDLTISSSVSGTFQISTDGFNYVDSLTLSPYDGIISPTTIYTQFAPNLVLGGYSGSIEFSSSVASASVFVTGSGIQEPVISMDWTGYSTDFGAVLINTSSSQQQFTVDGNYLVDDITVNGDPPAGFLISLTSGSGYTSSLVVTQSGGVVSAVPVYAVFYSTASGAYISSIGISSLYATNVNQIIQGTALSPSVYFNPTLINFGTLENGFTSSQAEFIVSGSDIVDYIEVKSGGIVRTSLTSGSGYSNAPLILTQSANIVAPITVYTILTPATEPLGNYTATFKINSTGSAEQFLYLSGSVI
jgi:hypothetical protein